MAAPNHLTLNVFTDFRLASHRRLLKHITGVDIQMHICGVLYSMYLVHWTPGLNIKVIMTKQHIQMA